MENWIFISYRRDDSGPEARNIRDAIQKDFSEESVFFDTNTPLGAVWPTEIQSALEHCTLVLAIIGPHWITSHDEWGQRRIDSDSDWVRQELASALHNRNKVVIPVYVNGVKRPPPNVLPDLLRGLVERQDIEIRRDFWDHDIRLLLAQLENLRPAGQYKSEEEIGPYPIMHTVPPEEIAEEKLKAILSKQLTSWIKVCSPLPEDPAQMRIELYKGFKFSNFRDAIRFMGEVAAGCEIADHHPRWENIYKTLSVYFTTWGIGHRISDRDIQLARYFDDAYRRFKEGVPVT